MKRYLLLASVAGCLLANNAMAREYTGNSGVVNISARISAGLLWNIADVNFGNILISEAAEVDDVIATFTNGTLTPAEGKVITNGSEEAGCIGFSSAVDAGLVTGISFGDSSVSLKDSSNQEIATVENLGVSALTTVTGECTHNGGDATEAGFFINGQLVLKNRLNADFRELTGTTTVTLQF